MMLITTEQAVVSTLVCQISLLEDTYVGLSRHLGGDLLRDVKNI